MKSNVTHGELNTLRSLLESKESTIVQKDSQIDDLRHILAGKDKEIEQKQKTADNLSASLAALRTQLDETTRTNTKLTAENARMSERLTIAENERQQWQQTIENIRKNSETQFRNIASEIFKSQTEVFQTSSERNLNQLLEPLKQNIETFRKRVDEAYGNEARERFSLQRELKNLMELNQSIGQEAKNLANALRGDSKVQGDWGEMILDRLLEMSGLKEGVHFRTQATTNADGSKITSADGRPLRPDVVIDYPDGRCVVIDSKVSLTAYMEYVNANPSDKNAIAEIEKKHLLSVKRHIAELADKKYQDIVGEHKLDFVMMFIPNEGAYMATMNMNPDIWQAAYEKRVLLTSPTHLIAALKMLEQLWKQDAVNKNVQEIARLSGTMVDKFVNFSADLQNINKHLTGASAAYTEAKKKLEEGRGNIISTAKKIVSLGAKTSKASELSRMESNEAIDQTTSSNQIIAFQTKE